MTNELRGQTKFRRVYVEDTDKLTELVGELAEAPLLGVDVEMGQRVQRHPGGLQEWIHVLALIQIAGGNLSIVVDPLRCSVEPLKRIMRGSSRKIFLGGGQDAALLDRAGIPVRNIADVGEIALALFGRREDGMAALAHRIFGISLDKTVRRADWLIRPLDPVLIAYGHRDAELTLQIYEWFARQHPEALKMHERVEFEPNLPDSVPLWLREAVSRSSADALAISMEFNLSPVEDAEAMSRDVRAALSVALSPRLINRLLRLTADLQLRPLFADVVPYTESISSMLRSSAARAIGRIAEPDAGIAVLEGMSDEPIEDVKKAIAAALRELRTPPPTEEEATPDEAGSQLGDDALSALMRLKAQLEDGEG